MSGHDTDGTRSVTGEAERTPEPSRLIATLASVPLFFLGTGIYRAWIELVYVRPLVTFPTWKFAGHDAFDGAFAVTLLTCALLSRRIEPLAERRWAPWTAGALMMVGTVCSFGSMGDPGIARFMAAPGAISAGAGTALIVLLWSEFFSRMNTTRVALYYSMSLLLGAGIVVVMRGFVPGYQAVFTTALPMLSALCVVMSLREVPRERCRAMISGRFSFPWKPVALMAVYAFAYGIRERAIYLQWGPHSSWGVVFVAAVVMVGVLSQNERFDFSLVYRVGLPLMVGGLLLVPMIAEVPLVVSNFCVSASYNAFMILILLILSNISYRYGVSAVWLFGIERGLRALVMWIGRMSGALLAASGLSITAQSTLFTLIVALLVLACTMIFLSEREMSSRWGVTFFGGDGEADEEVCESARLASRCAELSTRYHLTSREAEVLQLLAERKTTAEIEKELFISRGTAKAHLAHIYQKFGIHTRGELLEMAGVDES